MNPKQYRFLELFSELSVAGTDDKAKLNKLIKSFLELDFAKAAEVWEYLVLSNESQMKDGVFAALFSDNMFSLFEAKASARAYKTVTDVPAICRAMCQYSPEIANENGKMFLYLTDLLVGGKLKDGEEILKCLVKNEAIGEGYGKVMKKLMEKLFVELMKRSSSKRVEMPKKLALLLKTYVSKIRTDEKAMLEQRIRELL